MNSIQMLGKLVIKQVVTDSYKQKAGSQFVAEIEKIDQDIKVYEESMICYDARTYAYTLFKCKKEGYM